MKFSDLNLNTSLLNALNDLGLIHPTAIQEKVFSPIMAGRDVVGIAQTGTGKTFAYLLPSLRLWKFNKSPYPQILIVVPTRELVMQVVEEVKKLTTYMSVEVVGVYGGTNIKTQKAEVEVGLDVIVGTPGRLGDLLKDGVLKLKQVKRVILDEVDEMLDRGFRSQLNDIIDFLPPKRQHLMFSATMTEEVMGIIEQFTEYYEEIETAPSGAPLENIEQYGYEVPNFNSKANLLEHLLKTELEMKKNLVFAGTKRMADALFERLSPVFGEEIGVIHADKSQNYRFNTVGAFDAGSLQTLIATDLVARGLDVSSVTHVVNFDVSETPEKHVHRIGRTGRATERGVAISFVSEAERPAFSEIESLMGQSIPIRALPESVVLTDELIDLERDPLFIPDDGPAIEVDPNRAAFHEKKDKNQKVNNKLRRREKMALKYKKPQTRGQKPRGKKKRKK
jgi:ATP-dependent RNA helicase RhlE